MNVEYVDVTAVKNDVMFSMISVFPFVLIVVVSSCSFFQTLLKLEARLKFCVQNKNLVNKKTKKISCVVSFSIESLQCFQLADTRWRLDSRFISVAVTAGASNDETHNSV